MVEVQFLNAKKQNPAVSDKTVMFCQTLVVTHLIYFRPVGLEAKRVFDDGQRLLNKIIDNGKLKGKGLVGFWPAQSEGDDINVYAVDVTAPRQTQPIAKFHGLRQQVSPLQLLQV